MSADNLYCHGPAARGNTKEYLPHAARAKSPAQPVRPNQLRISQL
jgi:hypothetical protein